MGVQGSEVARDWWDFDQEQRKAVCAWLRENGLDPGRMPANPHPKLVDGQLTVWVKVGERDRLDPDNPGEVLKETVTVTISVPPTPLVEEWLNGAL